MVCNNKKHFPDIDIFFSSEKYGIYVAEFLKVQHIGFDMNRNTFPISSSQIRKRPSKYWNFIPAVAKPFFVKKIAIVGSESTGKSTLTEKLANHYNTQFVAEMARNIVCHSNDCTYEDLENIAVDQSATSGTVPCEQDQALIFHSQLAWCHPVCKGSLVQEKYTYRIDWPFQSILLLAIHD